MRAPHALLEVSLRHSDEMPLQDQQHAHVCQAIARTLAPKVFILPLEKRVGQREAWIPLHASDEAPAVAASRESAARTAGSELAALLRDAATGM